MSVVLKRELQCLMRAVANHEAEREAERLADERKRAIAAQRTHQQFHSHYVKAREKIRNGVLTTLRKTSPLGTQGIADRLGLDRSAVYKHLIDMAANSQVRRLGSQKRPEWALATTAKTQGAPT